VRGRANLINTVRGLVKSAGGRIPSGSAERFHLVAPEHVPDGLEASVGHLLALIESMTKSIEAFDKQLTKLAKTKYPVTTHLSEVHGVGTLTALAFVLTVADPSRFKKSRSVGAYLGLVPRQQASSSLEPELRITKAGDALMRRLLVQSAQCNLRKRAADSDVRRHGLAIAARGGKKAKKRAVIAVARKIAVLLHRLWVTGEVYEPLRNSAAKDSKKGNETRATS
jgi:transposase